MRVLPARGRRICLLILLALTLGACSAEPAPTGLAVDVTSPPTTRTIEPSQVSELPDGPRRVILISVEAGRSDWMEQWGADGTMPVLGLLRERGSWAEVQPVEPASSTVMHASLTAGLPPSSTGIVGERVHRVEDAFYWYTSTLDLPMSPAEPVWNAASRAGLATAVLFWPGAVPTWTEHLADYTVGYGERLAYSRQHHLSFYPAQGWDGAPISDSPFMESWLEIGDQGNTLATVFVLAIDPAGDQREGYDTFILSESDRVVTGEDSLLRAGGWASLSLDSAIGSGTDLFITDPSVTSFTVFQSGVHRIVADPPDLQYSLIGQFDYFPAPPDYYALEHGWISDQQFMDMLRRQSEWMMDVTLWVYRTYQPNLLLTVQSPIKQAGHQFLLLDGRQPGYSDGLSHQYAENLTGAASQLDSVLERLNSVVASEMADGSTAIMVVRTGGMVPIHTQVNVNTVLQQAGLLVLDRRDYVVVERSGAIAFSSGGSAWVYINLFGREEEGIVSEVDYPEVRGQIVDILTTLTDPATGEAVLESVVFGDNLAAVGVGGPYAGDIFIRARPGYYLDDVRGAEAIFEPSSFYGHQGYSSILLEMQGGFIGVGPGFEAGADLGHLSLLDIAPMLSELLGFEF